MALSDRVLGFVLVTVLSATVFAAESQPSPKDRAAAERPQATILGESAGTRANAEVMAIGKCCNTLLFLEPPVCMMVTEVECFSNFGWEFDPTGQCTGNACRDCPRCTENSACGDGNECTSDRCGECGCINEPRFDAATQCCDPDYGSIQSIDDGNACTLDGACDQRTGNVSRLPAPAGTVCDDGDACTVAERCDGSGACLGAATFDETTECCDPRDGTITLIDDSDVCTVDGPCDPNTGTVSRFSAPVGTVCDDGDVCTANDQCDGARHCRGLAIAGGSCTSDADCTPGVCQLGVCVCPPPAPIPTMSEWGLLAALLLLAVGARLVFRQGAANRGQDAA